LEIFSGLVEGRWMEGEPDAAGVVEASGTGGRECDAVTVGGTRKLGNQSGVRVCDAVLATKAKSWEISRLEGKMQYNKTMYTGVS
jgi:hypothetical protein